jgi:hypothetical protein
VEESNRVYFKVISCITLQDMRKPATCIGMISWCDRTHYEYLKKKSLGSRRINEGIRYGSRKFLVYTDYLRCCI